MNKPTNKELGQQLVRNNKIAVSYKKKKRNEPTGLESNTIVNYDDLAWERKIINDQEVWVSVNKRNILTRID